MNYGQRHRAREISINITGNVEKNIVGEMIQFYYIT